MGLDESGRYLSQVWEGGTVCDKTGMPRSVEVQVRRDYYPLYVLFCSPLLIARLPSVSLQHSNNRSDSAHSRNLKYASQIYLRTLRN